MPFWCFAESESGLPSVGLAAEIRYGTKRDIARICKLAAAAGMADTGIGCVFCFNLKTYAAASVFFADMEKAV